MQDQQEYLSNSEETREDPFRTQGTTSVPVGPTLMDCGSDSAATVHKASRAPRVGCSPPQRRDRKQPQVPPPPPPPPRGGGGSKPILFPHAPLHTSVLS